jgi:hypothetical protein
LQRLSQLVDVQRQPGKHAPADQGKEARRHTSHPGSCRPRVRTNGCFRGLQPVPPPDWTLTTARSPPRHRDRGAGDPADRTGWGPRTLSRGALRCGRNASAAAQPERNPSAGHSRHCSSAEAPLPAPDWRRGLGLRAGALLLCHGVSIRLMPEQALGCAGRKRPVIESNTGCCATSNALERSPGSRRTAATELLDPRAATSPAP